MIIAKTRMRTIPQTCKTCSISYFDGWGEKCCGINHKECPFEVTAGGRIAYGKPHWCPLVEVKEDNTDA